LGVAVHILLYVRDGNNYFTKNLVVVMGQ
jgi:hypothetical protein